MKLNFTVKMNPETGEPVDPQIVIHDAITEWIINALSTLKCPDTGNSVSYTTLSTDAQNMPIVRTNDPAFQAQANSLIQEKFDRENPLK